MTLSAVKTSAVKGTRRTFTRSTLNHPIFVISFNTDPVRIEVRGLYPTSRPDGKPSEATGTPIQNRPSVMHHQPEIVSLGERAALLRISVCIMNNLWCYRAALSPRNSCNHSKGVPLVLARFYCCPSKRESRSGFSLVTSHAKITFDNYIYVVVAEKLIPRTIGLFTPTVRYIE